MNCENEKPRVAETRGNQTDNKINRCINSNTTLEKSQEHLPVIPGKVFRDPEYNMLRVQVRCPFCGRKHHHGFGNGNVRLAHCYVYNDNPKHYAIDYMIGAIEI